jgi:hypothetical protein
LPTRRSTPRRRLGVLAALLLPLLVGTIADSPVGSRVPGAPWFEPSKPYTQNFPDPHVIRVGDAYYAYATGTGGPTCR